MKRLYLVMECKESMKLNIGQDLHLSWADGMIGASPIFSNKRKAQKYANLYHKSNRPEIKSFLVGLKKSDK